MITKEQILEMKKSLELQARVLDGLYGDIAIYLYYHEENRSPEAQKDIDRRLKEVYNQTLKALKSIKPKTPKKRKAVHAV